LAGTTIREALMEINDHSVEVRTGNI